MAIRGAQRLVRDFHIAMDGDNRTAPNKPTALDFETSQLRINLIKEELDELRESLFTSCGDGAIDLLAIDAIADLLVVVLGTAVAMGVDIEPFFIEVMKSNMSKQGGERRSDGKYLKPEGYVKPDIKAVYDKLYP